MVGLFIWKDSRVDSRVTCRVNFAGLVISEREGGKEGGREGGSGRDINGGREEWRER